MPYAKNRFSNTPEGKPRDPSERALYFLSIDNTLRSFLRKSKYKVQPDDYVSCYYYREKNMNIVGESREVVVNHFRTDPDKFFITVCKIKHINVDLTSIKIKEMAEYNKKMHPMHLPTISQRIDKLQSKWKKQQSQKHTALDPIP